MISLASPRRFCGRVSRLILPGLACAAVGVAPVRAEQPPGAPRVAIDRPDITWGVGLVAPAPVTFGYTAVDPDAPDAQPARVRWLLRRTSAPPTYWREPPVPDDHVSYTDSAWCAWRDYPPDPAERTISFADLPPTDETGRSVGYILALQVMDADGSVSTDLVFGTNCVWFRCAADPGSLAPELTVHEPLLGELQDGLAHGRYAFDVAPGQPLAFQWVGSTAAYLATVTGYRWGWDVADPGDEEDPGWAVPWGDTPEHRSVLAQALDAGIRALTVHCRDDAGGLTRLTLVLSVVPVPPLAERRPLLLVDDVIDRSSNAWPGEDGVAYDNDAQRDAFWARATAGVAGFDPQSDIVDAEVDDDFGFRDLAAYRAVVWTHRRAIDSYIGAHFDRSGGDRYVWLAAFQERVGNLFLCAQEGMLSFIGFEGMLGAETPEGLPRLAASWVMPVIFDTLEEYVEYQNRVYALGFGRRLLPDGAYEAIGPATYPYRAWGIAAFDDASPAFMTWSGTPVNSARKPACTGLKGLVVDPAFRDAHVTAGVFPDTILAARVIDWQDYRTPYPTYPRLQDPFAWSRDEFYDTNVTARPTPIDPQTLPDGSPAIEPMWRWHARYSWIDDLHHRRGDPEWPGNVFTQEELRAICGSAALTPDGFLRVEGVPPGFVSRRTVATKPGGRPDVMWGFDPSRFDRTAMARVVQWVLTEVWGLPVLPPPAAAEGGFR